MSWTARLGDVVKDEHGEATSRVEASLLELAAVDNKDNVFDCQTRLRNVCRHDDLPHTFWRLLEGLTLLLRCDSGVQLNDPVRGCTEPAIIKPDPAMQPAPSIWVFFAILPPACTGAQTPHPKSAHENARALDTAQEHLTRFILSLLLARVALKSCMQPAAISGA